MNTYHATSPCLYPDVQTTDSIAEQLATYSKKSTWPGASEVLIILSRTNLQQRDQQAAKGGGGELRRGFRVICYMYSRVIGRD